MTFDKDEAFEQIGDCENRSEKLSDWELEFIDSISHQLTRTGSLSENQVETVLRTWSKVT